MKNKEIKAAIEAILFAAGSPVPISRIIEALEVKKSVALELIQSLQQDYNKDSRGLTVIKLQDSYQMCNKKEYGEYIRKVMDLRRNAPLSQAAMEVLAVIAYNQPVTKAFVEQVRGVDCSGVVGSLTTKGLIEEKGRLELPGRPLLYGTTENFLRCFQIDSIENLPPLPEKEQGKSKEASKENSEKDNKADKVDSTDNTRDTNIASTPQELQNVKSEEAIIDDKPPATEENAEELLTAMGIVREIPHDQLTK
ncbi:MAG TPA: SMC-Scp complex subunit ScpB [Clostridiales bacterium]|nr:SMC-Scp complex subunit ScpB [Clostridiales bacterium]